MNIVYIAKASIPSTSANSVHVMKISEAFDKLTEKFSLIIPAPNGKDVTEGFGYYGVRKFKIKMVSICKKPGIRSRYGFACKSMIQALRLHAEIIITRDPIVAFLGIVFHKQVVLDLHGDLAHLCGRAYRMIRWKYFVENERLHLVMISEGLKQYYIDEYGVNPKLITVLPDGYTAENFGKIEKRAILQNESLNIGYCGSFLKGKGLGIIQRLTLEDENNIYHLYGGSRETAEKEAGGKFSSNTIFHGHIPNALVPEALNEQDILLLPNQVQLVCMGEDIGKVTSPIKMFEYMASGRVVVASDIPVLREVLTEENSYLVSAENVEEWKKIIQYINVHREEAVMKTKKAEEDVLQFTWEKRAEKMLKLC